MATEIGHRLGDLADRLESSGKTTYAGGLRENACRVSGILAEGSSCPGKIEFAIFVAQARGATLLVANQIIFLAERELIDEAEEAELVSMIKRESKMLENFRQSLERAERPQPMAV